MVRCPWGGHRRCLANACSGRDACCLFLLLPARAASRLTCSLGRSAQQHLADFSPPPERKCIGGRCAPGRTPTPTPSLHMAPTYNRLVTAVPTYDDSATFLPTVPPTDDSVYLLHVYLQPYPLTARSAHISHSSQHCGAVERTDITHTLHTHTCAHTCTTYCTYTNVHYI